MTIVVDGDERTLDQIKKQLNKLIDVIKVVDYKEGGFLDRELILVKVAVTAKTRPQILEAVETSGARIENAGSRSISVEASGDQVKINTLIELLRPFGILEVVRTGRIAMDTSDRGLKADGKPEVNE
jgi:acetolactate synthase-1/3 small subunit